MRTKLFWSGTILAAAAALFGLASLDVDARGFSSLNPVGAIAIGVAALALLYASTVTPEGPTGKGPERR